MPCEVWITGAGSLSALGSGIESLRAAAAEGRTGLQRAAFFNGAPPDPCMCGMVAPDFLNCTFEESAPDRADRLVDYALGQALVSAGLRTGAGIGGDALCSDLVAGTTLGNMAGATKYYGLVRKGQPADTNLVKHFVPCAPLLAAARHYAIQGKRLTVSSACGSGSAAIGHAFLSIRNSRAGRVIAGGFDALSPFVVAGFNSLRLVSNRECRPFDKDRDGLNPGEGAVMLVLESADCANKRGAKPLARIIGFGDGLDAFHHTRAHPEGKGLAEAIIKALACAALTPDDIDHIHMHGTGTSANDTSEYHACRSVFGERLASIPACSTKSMTGHTFGAAGALNALFAVTTLQSGIVPPTLFLEMRDPELSDLNVSNKGVVNKKIKTVLCTALGFGGESFAMVLSK